MRAIKIINNVITETKTVLNGYVLRTNEIQSDTGELGQIMQPDGTFITPEPIPSEDKPSLEEQIAGLKEDNLILMDVLATMYEDMLMKGTV